MITDNDILSRFFKLINVSSVLDEIDGQVWIGEKPIDREFEDIVINMLTSKQEFNSELMIGIININCFSRMNVQNMRDSARLIALTGFVISALNFAFGEGSDGPLSYRIESQKTFRDNDNPRMYYSNLKLNFSHKNF